MKRLVMALAALAVLGGAGLYWKYHASAPLGQTAAAPAAKAPSGVPVKVGTVRTGAISEEVSAVGTLLANESVMIRPEREEAASRRSNSPKGRSCARERSSSCSIRPKSRAQLAAVSSELTLNRSRLRRAQDLHEKKFISAQALDDAREAVNQSAARHAGEWARLDKSAVIAPFEGVAGLRQVSPGAYVKAGQDIARLEGIGTLNLDFRVPEVYLGRIRTRQEVVVRVDAFANERFQGEIFAIEPSVDEQTRTVLLRARVPNPGARLTGMFSRVALVLEGARTPSSLEQALVPQGSDRFVRYAEGGPRSRKSSWDGGRASRDPQRSPPATRWSSTASSG
jgi:membrane fusion protein (multidrug efflux system)